MSIKSSHSLPLLISLAITLTQCAPSSNHSENPPSVKTFQKENVRKVITYNTPGRSNEIISYSSQTGLLFTTNSVSKEISVLSLTDFSKGNFSPIDMDSSSPGVQGIKTNGEPTSIAIHPSKNIALAPVNGSAGRLTAFDISKAREGKVRIILDQEIGIHLDSIAISPDGKWAVIADEAEKKANTPGAIILMDLTNLGSSAKLPIYKVEGLAAALGRPAGRVEPEFVCIDSASRFAVIACQEDNAVVIVPLGKTPKVSSVIKLPSNSSPDGVALIQYGNGMLLSIAEEGTNSASLYFLNPNNLSQTPQLVSRINVRLLSGHTKRSDPEGIAMFRQSGKLYLAVAIERADKVLIMDISNPSSPKKIAAVPVGSRPEGIITLKQNGMTYILTGDEGKPGKGEVSIIEVR